MKIISYTLISVMLLSILFILSCGGGKSDDKTPPVIEEVRFNLEDTIVYNDTISLDPLEVVLREIAINEIEKDAFDPDTLIIGHPITLNGIFRDDVGLSTIFVHIWGDTIYDPTIENVADTCYRLKRMPELHLFGKTERVVEDYVLVDKLPTKLRRSSTHGSTEVVVRATGEKAGEQYQFSISCVDMAGNVDSISYNREKIVVLKRETIIADRKNRK